MWIDIETRTLGGGIPNGPKELLHEMREFYNYCVSIKNKRPLRSRYGERVYLLRSTAKMVRKRFTRSAISTLSTIHKRRSTRHTHYWKSHTSALRSQASTLHHATTAHTRARLLLRFRLAHALPKPRQKTTSLSCVTPR